MRQPERAARQGGRADPAAQDDGRIDVRALSPDELELVDAHLPLARLDGCGAGRCFYLVAWDANEPVGHAHLELSDPPELQDVFVAPRRRREGIATALTRAAEREVMERGFDRLTLSVGIENEAAKRVYERAGYVDAGLEPKRVQGTIVIRGEPIEVDDTLVYLEKRL